MSNFVRSLSPVIKSQPDVMSCWFSNWSSYKNICKIWQDQVSMGVSIFCSHARLVANAIWKSPTVTSNLIIINFSGSPRSPVLNKHFTWLYTYFQVQCSVWNGHPFYIFPLSKFWNESNFPSLAFMKWSFHISCLELHDSTPFKPNNF